MSAQRLTLIVVALLLAAQIALGAMTIDRHDYHDPLTQAPTRQVAHALSLGDHQFFFRQGVLTVTHAGGVGGETIILPDFDYHALASWFLLLDELDSRSTVVPFLAAYWYGHTPVVDDAALMVDYLATRAAHDPQNGWRWLVEAVYLARYKLDDLDLARQLASHAATSNQQNAPAYVKHLPAFIELDLGERDAAIVLLNALLEADPNMPEDEVNLLLYMIDRIETDAATETPAGGSDGGEMDGS